MSADNKTQKKIVSVTNEGASPIVLTGPHNGWRVPDELTKDGAPLGLPVYWFDPQNDNHRHEACDWGMQALFNEISAQRPDICLVSAELSRLVVDLNRVPSDIIYSTSSETNTPLAGNTNLPEGEKERRLQSYYAPYHAQVDKTLQGTQEKFAQKPLWIDMHSFTPVWQGNPRAVGVGTLKLEKTAFTDKAEGYLSATFGALFKPDQPYDMRVSPSRDISAGREIAERNNMEYLGLEIRNDLLRTPEQIKDIASKMIGLIDHLYGKSTSNDPAPDI